jgi:uncharacterized membrane protein (DUF4010 family)
LVSSTVVTAELGRRVRTGETHAMVAGAAAAIAAAVSVGRCMALLAVAGAAILPHAGPALAAAALTFVLGAFAMRRLDRAAGRANAAEKLRSPLDLISVAQFALLLGAIIVIGRIVADAYGQAGLLPFAATAGLADVDAVTLAAGSLVRGGLDATVAGNAVMLAVLVNTVAKGGIAAATGGWRYAGLYFAAALAAAGVAALAWMFATPFVAPLFGLEASLAPRLFG